MCLFVRAEGLTKFDATDTAKKIAVKFICIWGQFRLGSAIQYRVTSQVMSKLLLTVKEKVAFYSKESILQRNLIFHFFASTKAGNPPDRPPCIFIEKQEENPSIEPAAEATERQLIYHVQTSFEISG